MESGAPGGGRRMWVDREALAIFHAVPADMHDELERIEAQEVTRLVVETLKPRERKVLALRYGIQEPKGGWALREKVEYTGGQEVYDLQMQIKKLQSDHERTLERYNEELKRCYEKGWDDAIKHHNKKVLIMDEWLYQARKKKKALEREINAMSKRVAAARKALGVTD